MPLDSVRPSRAGDQFHYLWAARRCLRLLLPNSKFVALTIEGVSDSETSSSKAGSGEEVIDVAEYYGSEELSKCHKVTYLQLKHSTVNTERQWVLSDLKRTLVGFYRRYKAFLCGIESPDQQKVEFEFLTNRPVADWVHALLGRARKRDLLPDDVRKWEQIKSYLSTNDEETYAFLERLKITDTADGYWEQRNILTQEASGYLPGPDQGGADQLLLLVADKALPKSADNPSIRKEDVLRALKTDEEQLYPAPCLIEEAEGLLPREQEDEFVDIILNETEHPIVIHAGSGVGKSAIASTMSNKLQNDATAVLYDCFGNGGYRSTISPRHRHEVGCCQIANELAARGLCHPLIPSRLATPADYLKALDRRLRQATRVLSADSPSAKIVIMIDAADNAQLAAEERGEQTSFPRDLLRQNLPDGVVLVCLSRSHRVEKYLAPPLDYTDLELAPFSEVETKLFLRKSYPDASEEDVHEFHRLSSQNPRVQATALATTFSLPETLEALGPTATTVEDTIRQLFQRSISLLMDQSPGVEATQIRSFCEALAALRPFVPIRVLSLASGLPEDAIRSFVVDIGRPLLVRSDAIQFFDEPSETWFRETYKPSSQDLSAFVEKMVPLASEDSYVASALPQLMLEAEKYDDLVEMVLSEAALPQANPAERRQASLSRLQFALKAALRRKRLSDAAKLSLKAGVETAGDDRQQQLFQDNTDLVAQFLSDDQVLETAANNDFSTAWHGGHRAYEAGLLAGRPGTISEARNTLRVAKRWLRTWARLDPETRREEEVKHRDVAELAFASLQVHGPEAFVAELESWTPKSVAYRAGLIVARKLVDLGRYNLLDEISTTAMDNLCILLAITQAQSEVLRFPSKDAVLRAYDGIASSPRWLKKYTSEHDYREPLLPVVHNVALAAAHYDVAPRSEIAATLAKHIPDPAKSYFSNFSAEPKSTIISVNCLRARLDDEEITLKNLAKSEVQEELARGKQVHGRETHEFLEEVGSVFRWHMLWVRAQLGELKSENLADEFDCCLKDYYKNLEYRERGRRHIAGEVSRLWLQILTTLDNPDPYMDKFFEWKEHVKSRLFTPDLCFLARTCANFPSLKKFANSFAAEAAEIIRNERMEAEQKVEGFCEVSRSIFVLSLEEASCYFELAVDVASRIGEEHLDYWKAILELSERAAVAGTSQPELAYRVSRAAEVAYDYVARDKHFDWEGTIEAITCLCPTSSLAVLSRWRDRNFGWQDDVTIALSKLVDMKEISPKSHLATLGFGFHSQTAEMLTASIDAGEDRQLKQKMFCDTVRYSLISGVSSSQLRKLEKVGISHKWPVDLLGAHRAVSERREARADQNGRHARGTDYSVKETRNWDAIFLGLNPEAPESVSACRKRFREGEPPFYAWEFAAHFFERVLVGKEAAALRSLLTVEDVGLFDVRGILEALPEGWRKLPSVRRALKETVEKICRRHFRKISKNRYYQPLPFEFIKEVTGISEVEVFRIVVDESSKHPELFGSQRLLTLAGLIASQITRQEAQDSLRFGLALIEEEMDDRDGDGQWRQELQPPANAATALAGYTWSCLAAPEVSQRWQAAHVVCLLCSFNETDVLSALGRLAIGKEPNVFCDTSLPFYEYAAKQWLLLAVRRALSDDRCVPDGLVSFIRENSGPTVKHMIIRGIAAECALTLSERGVIELDEGEQTRLRNVNLSGFSRVPKATHDLVSLDDDQSDNEDDRYYFGWDLPEYWFGPLGRVFGMSSTEIERRTLKVIRSKWQEAATGAWAEDPRGKKGLYKGMDAHHSHGSYPRTESLSFYHAYNAMMEVAGDLIDTTPARESPEYDDRLEDWIQRHWITRTDRKWLADRRDPDPPIWPAWKDEEEAEVWPFSVDKNDLLGQISDQDRVPIWGGWTEVSGDREQSVRISSALVSPTRSMALLRALQTASSPMNYRLPAADDDMEIKAGPFELRGWISIDSNGCGIDEYDPWAGVVSYPALRPDVWICDRLHLSSDPEGRTWQASDGAAGVQFSSQTWGRREAEREYQTPESGARLEMPKNALLHCLNELRMDLIMEIQVRRKFRRGSYRYRETSLENYVPPYNLIVRITSDGTVETI